MKQKFLKIGIIVLVAIMVTGVLAMLIINSYVKYVGGKYILSSDEAAKLEKTDCIIVLGCGVRDDGTPSDMLSDRLKRGIELYEKGAAPKLLMSGDHGRKTYDEVNTMKKIAIDTGISSEDIFMDHAGFSTYESMYRAKDVFKAEKVIIVTQEYHLYRSLYIARKLGLDAVGVSADYHTYIGQNYRDAREIIARCKDFVKTLFKPEPTFLGETIPVSGNGDITND